MGPRHINLFLKSCKGTGCPAHGRLSMQHLSKTSSNNFYNNALSFRSARRCVHEGIGMLHKKLFYPKVIEVRLVADQTDLHGGTAARELNCAEQQKQTSFLQ